jgi:peptidyl-tRNA hydrolase
MNNPVIYVFINKGLHMSAGKVAAQAIHAAMMGTIASDKAEQEAWGKAIHKTVIVLEARDEAHIKNIRQYLEDRDFDLSEIVDEGVNEIDPHVTTALASTIIEKDNEDVVKAFSTFNLYKDVVRATVEFER